MHVITAKGFTFTESLIVLALFSVSIVFLPAITQWQQKQTLLSQRTELRTLISTARNDSLQYNQSITLCSLDTLSRCRSDWSGSIVLFKDYDSNRALTETEQILQRLEIPPEIQIQWKGTLPKNSIHFAGNGMTSLSNGTLYLCHRKLNFQTRIIINKQGRSRTEPISEGCDA